MSSDRETIARLAQRIVRLERGHAALARASQLPSSTVALPGGGDVPVGEAVEIATDTEANLGAVSGQVDDLSGTAVEEAATTSTVPDWIGGAGESSNAAFEAARIAYERGRAAKAEAEQAIEDAANALTTSNGKNSRRRGVTEPSPPPGGWVQGDQWVRDVLDEDDVPRPVEVLVWNGSAFVHETTLTGELLVIGENGAIRLAEGVVTADALVADAIDGMIITGALFRTAAAGRRLQFDTLGLRSFDEAGNEVGRFETRDDGFHFFGDIFTWPTGDMNDPAARFTAALIEFMGGGSPYEQNARLTRQGLTSTARATGSHLLVQHDSGDVSDAEVRIVAKWTKLFPPNAGVQSTTLAVHPDGVFIDDQPVRHAEAAGEALFTGAINNGSGTTLTITFPVGRFTEPPIVTAAALSSSRLNVAVLRSSVTKDDCQIRLDNFSGANMGAGTNNGVTWHAVQMTKGSGAG